MSQLWLEDSGDDCIILVQIQPNSSQNQILGVGEWRGRLRLSIIGPPISGKANSELLELLSSWLSINKADISIVKGHKSRKKSIRVKNVKSNQIMFLLGE